MSISDFKKVLLEIKDDPDSLNNMGDELDGVIRELIGIEKKHLYQVESTSARRRLQEVRELLEEKLPKVMGSENAS